MARAYILKRKDGWSPDRGLTAHMFVVQARIVVGRGPWTLLQNDDVLLEDRPRDDVLRRYRDVISHREIGDTFRIRNSNEVKVAGRAIIPAPDVINTNGNRNADLFWSWVVATYPQYHPRFAGAYVCRNVSGSSTRSQHSYGNGVDVFFDSAAHQEVVWNDIRQGKCPVRVCHAISLKHIWEPGSGVSYYSGDTHYHLHVDFCPQCSGACGVRNC